MELWSLVSPPTASASMVVRSQDGVVIEVKAWTNGHTGDGYSGIALVLVTGQSIGGFGKRAVRSQDGVLIEVKYDRFLAETSRTRTPGRR
jgi:hypothetical protein